MLDKWSPNPVQCPECERPLTWYPNRVWNGYGKLVCLDCKVTVPILRMEAVFNPQWPKDRWHAIYLRMLLRRMKRSQRLGED